MHNSFSYRIFTNEMVILIHLSRLEFPTLIIGPVHFRFNGCWVVFFHFIQILIEPSLVEITFCRCPIQRTLGLNGLKTKQNITLIFDQGFRRNIAYRNYEHVSVDLRLCPLSGSSTTEPFAMHVVLIRWACA